MIYGCKINGIHSSTLNLFMLSKSRPILSDNNDSYSQISGKSGSYLNPQQHNDRIIKVMFSVINPSLYDMRVSNRKIAAWLNSKDRVRIILDDESDKFYFGKVDGVVDFEQFVASGTLTVSFRCQPFASMVISTATDSTWDDADFPWTIDVPWMMGTAYKFLTTIPASFTFEHPGTQDVSQSSPQGSKFDLIISGAWTTLSLILNGKTIGYAGAGTGTLIIDSVNMETTLDGVNKLDLITGDIDSFLSIEPGTNTIQVTGTGLDITATLDFAPMWL